MDTVKDRISEALRLGNRETIQAAIYDWLSGIDTDEELAREIERETDDSKLSQDALTVQGARH